MSEDLSELDDDWKPLTVADVEERVAWIASHLFDDESCHATDDAIRNGVLAAIADGAPNGQELAAAALKTNDLEFSRWYA